MDLSPIKRELGSKFLSSDLLSLSKSKDSEITFGTNQATSRNKKIDAQTPLCINLQNLEWTEESISNYSD